MAPRRKHRLARILATCAAAAAWTLAADADAGGYRPPRTTSGAPDLQGTWTNLSLTQLERPADAKALILDDAQGAAVERKIMIDEAAVGVGGTDPGFSEDRLVHLARIDGRIRSSWITDPADGRLPFTPEARAEFARRNAAVLTAFDDPEARDISERCLIVVGTTPILNLNFSANYQIAQTPREVAIYYEINHEVRIIRLNGRHPPKDVRLWMGDSIGHWEKDTLVVETTNFRAEEYYRLDLLVSAEAKVTERFERISPTEMRYAFSVDDPKTYTQTWRAEMPFHTTRAPMYEYACHEGNYSLPNVLAAARKLEAQGAAAPP